MHLLSSIKHLVAERQCGSAQTTLTCCLPCPNLRTILILLHRRPFSTPSFLGKLGRGRWLVHHAPHKAALVLSGYPTQLQQHETMSTRLLSYMLFYEALGLSSAVHCPPLTMIITRFSRSKPLPHTFLRIRVACASLETGPTVRYLDLAKAQGTI